jgi:hypothetical protein
MMFVIPQRSGGICFFRCLCLFFLFVIPEGNLLLPFAAACSCPSFWRSQNLRIPFDAQIPQNPTARAFNPSINTPSLTYE